MSAYLTVSVTAWPGLFTPSLVALKAPEAYNLLFHRRPFFSNYLRIVPNQIRPGQLYWLHPWPNWPKWSIASIIAVYFVSIAFFIWTHSIRHSLSSPSHCILRSMCSRIGSISRRGRLWIPPSHHTIKTKAHSISDSLPRSVHSTLSSSSNSRSLRSSLKSDQQLIFLTVSDTASPTMLTALFVPSTAPLACGIRGYKQTEKITPCRY